MSYSLDLIQDFARLNLSSDQQPVQSYVELVTLLSTSCMLGTAKRDPETIIDGADLLTPLGKIALDAISHGIVFGREQTVSCCEEAEWKFAMSLDPEDVQNKQLRSPLLITDGGEPVAVLKSYGERTVYAFQDRLNIGLVKGSIATTSIPIDPHSLPRSSRAYTYEILPDDCFFPVRFSAFATPVGFRQTLTHDEPEDAIAIRTSHAELVQNAHRVLPDASAL
jgi:hypothetical protein